jgi:nucleotide sugar dehydrogenase
MGEDCFKIGIFGYGFLGSSIVFGFSSVLGEENIKIYDKFKSGLDTFETTVKESDIIFMCLPTPAFKDNGEVDLSAISDNLEKINELDNCEDKVIVIKSTIPPGTTDKFSDKYPRLRIIHNPEFLTGRTAKLDFINCHRIILGGNSKDVDVVEKLYRKRFGGSVLVFKTESKSAELVKYMCNLFFATKVTFMNIMYDVCNEIDVEYDHVKDMFFSDFRIGRSHMKVPGDDLDEYGNKLRGFGNLCFPKDLKSFIFFMRSLELDASFLQAVWDKNLTYRPNKDWEKIPGAFSNRDTEEE